MYSLLAVLAFAMLAASGASRTPVTAAAVADSLNQLTLDPAQTYHVRDLQLRRGGVSFYFTDGLLSFATAVEGKRVAAVFTCAGMELGDGEVVIMPPQAAERQSLAGFAKSPNLDEHFRSVILYFTDGTADELFSQIGRDDAPRMDLSPELRSQGEHVLRNASAQVKTRMVAAILDGGASENGFFYASVQGRDIGNFDVLYNPETREPLTVGRVSEGKPEGSRFELWTNYRPRNFKPPDSRHAVLSNYAIDATIHPDLSLSATARFDLAAGAVHGRVVALDISGKLHVIGATVDGAPVEVFQQVGDISNSSTEDTEFLLVSQEALAPERGHHIELSYSGDIISQVSASSYLVTERNLWYPHTQTMLTKFDLLFHCPEQFEIVSSGEAIEDRVENGIRTVHRKTESAQQMAGFNLGQYDKQPLRSAPYEIDSYEEKSRNGNFNGIPEKAAEILHFYTTRWSELSDHSLAITPVPGDFGQGFPGLIYLSRTAYLPEAERPSSERMPQNKIFFSDLLLPHEIAHQWWGNLVTADGYRSDWLMEAMANESALLFIAAEGDAVVSNTVMEQYRADLELPVDGKPIESYGPVDFGSRILTTAGLPAWHTILYKKGTWILEMLRARMGTQAFVRMQADVLKTYAGKRLSNEEFRAVASRYIPHDQPDQTLELFFDTWVYGTGIPKIGINRAGTKLDVSGVEDGFVADLPLHCKTKEGSERVRWLRIEAGQNVTPAPGCRLARADFLYFPR